MRTYDAARQPGGADEGKDIAGNSSIESHWGGAMKRRKTKGFAPHGPYAQIPVVPAKKVLAVLSAPEFRVWFALCMQNQHWNNGTGKLCRSVIREFHLGSQRVVTSATKMLLDMKFIVRTRKARQRACALYGVIHLPLNTDALAKAGLSDGEIRTVLARFAAIVCDTNRGSANGATTGEAQNSRTDIRGSAKPLEQPLAWMPTLGHRPNNSGVSRRRR